MYTKYRKINEIIEALTTLDHMVGGRRLESDWILFTSRQAGWMLDPVQQLHPLNIVAKERPNAQFSKMLQKMCK